MPSLRWTEQAREDLDYLYEFIALRNRAAAAKAIATIVGSAGQLALYPALGRPASERLEGFRELIVPFGRGAYVILYHTSRDEVLILAIRHGREAGF